MTKNIFDDVVIIRKELSKMYIEGNFDEMVIRNVLKLLYNIELEIKTKGVNKNGKETD